jgi:hypothetical protein
VAKKQEELNTTKKQFFVLIRIASASKNAIIIIYTKLLEINYFYKDMKF